LEFAYKQGDEWVPGIKADSQQVADYIERQLHRLWRHDIWKIIKCDLWGWAAAEIVYRRDKEKGTIEFHELLSRHARDTRALQQNGRFVGVQFSGVKTGEVRLGTPGNALWQAYRPEDGSFYGRSILRGAYSAWADKWHTGGANDVRRLFMHADAYGGKEIAYPPGTTEIDGLGDVPNRDIAREMVEAAKSGEVIVRPRVFDANGNELWKIERANVQNNPQHILQYPKDLDVEILRGLEIPDDFLTSGTTGSWAGKLVPMQAFYSGLNRFALDIVQTIVKQMLEPMVMWTFGRAVGFEVDIKPLEVQAMEMQKRADGNESPEAAQNEEEIPGGFGEFQEPARLEFARDTDSTEKFASVGAGEMAATDIVQQARAIEDSDNDGVIEESDFSSTQFDLSNDLADRVRKFGKSLITEVDLDSKGREDDPHITVLYGIHSENPDQVAHVLRS
jgi:hypothetical protein